MSHINIWIHIVWATKRRRPFLVAPHKLVIIEHIQEYGLQKGIFVDRINGYRDHVHVLASLGPSQSPSMVAQMLKGESTYWINNIYKKLPYRFEWQREYYAASVDYKRVPALRTYIDNQEIHHKKIDVDEEIRLILSRDKTGAKAH